MPFLTIDNARLFYCLEGNADRPVVVLSNSLGTAHGLWAPQMEDFVRHFRVLRYDLRGHGASDAPKTDYSIERLGRDVLGICDALGIGTFAFCGISLGGMIGQWLGAHAADRVTALILANSSAAVPPKSGWDERRELILTKGMGAFADIAMKRFFSAEFLATKNPHAASIRTAFLALDPAGYAGCCAAIRDMDQTSVLREIKVPTLVIGGDKDMATPHARHGAILAREIPGAKEILLPAAHLSNVERPRSFTAAVLEFLQPPPNDALTAGFAMRRATLGDAHVDRAMATATDFNRDFQELITRYAWGSVWTRPGLDTRTRRLLVLAVTASLGRWEEFRMHLNAGLGHELEPCDVKEVLLHVAIYAGAPAANTAFHVAAEEIKNGQTPR